MRRNTRKIIEMTMRTIPQTRDLTLHEIMEIKEMSDDDSGNLLLYAICNAFYLGFAQGKRYQKEVF